MIYFSPSGEDNGESDNRLAEEQDEAHTSNATIEQTNKHPAVCCRRLSSVQSSSPFGNCNQSEAIEISFHDDDRLSNCDVESRFVRELRVAGSDMGKVLRVDQQQCTVTEEADSEDEEIRKRERRKKNVLVVVLTATTRGSLPLREEAI